MNAARLAKSERLQRVDTLLATGIEYSTLDIITRAGVCAVNSIVAELRENGRDNPLRTQGRHLVLQDGQMNATGKKPKNTASALYQRQNTALHKAFELIGLPYNQDKEYWAGVWSVIFDREISGMSALTLGERTIILDDLKSRGANIHVPYCPGHVKNWKKGNEDKSLNLKKPGYPGRPKNMDAETSRAHQLRKIEAYIAEAGRQWAYADSLAQRICKVERVVWVPEDQLYKIITALKKDAERHGREPS